MGGQTEDYSERSISGLLPEDLQLFQNIFKKDDVLRTRTVHVNSPVPFDCGLLYMDGMVNVALLNDSIVRPLVMAQAENCEATMADYVERQLLVACEVSQTEQVMQMLRAILYGDTLLLIDGCTTALTINTKGWRTRGIHEPADERILQGPREGFDEAAMLNLAMIRRKLLTPDLCIEMQRVGRRTDTQVYLCYLESLADKKTVEQLKRRIAQMNIDGVLDTNYIAEHIRDHRFSLFKTTGTTERPDIVAARLLEGRIAVVVDGTPVVMTLPYLFSENFQSDEDYYLNFAIASVGRLLRYLCFFVAISVPAVYVSLVTLHQQLLPTSFEVSIAQLRGGVPLSSVGECVLLILIFEILKETGVRMPQSLGHALSIVGGLVVGQAAVQARIISAPMLIAVALSGICGLMIPRLKGVVFYMRLGLVLVCAVGGLYGYVVGIVALLIRIFSLSSFGVDYTVSLNHPTAQNLKDTLWRAPWTMMKRRPAFNRNSVRSKSGEQR